MGDPAEVEADLTVSKAPQTLYKFRSWNDENHRRLLTHNEIFFASPRHFNDPFDCRIPIQFLTGTKKQIRQEYMKYVREWEPDLNRQQWRSLVEKQVDNYVKMRKDPKAIMVLQDGFRRDIFSSFGVFSLSKNCDDILLWSHYADGHKGYCVGFDTQLLYRAVKHKLRFAPKIAQELFEVQYAKDFPKLAYFETGDEIQKKIELLNKSLTVKSTVWHYEQEWRLAIMYTTDKNVVLPEGVITTVILGASMPEKEQHEIKQELARRTRPVELLKAKTHKDSFGLDFIPID